MSEPATLPFAMCGMTNYKRTREHIFPKAWKTDFPWLNSDFNTLTSTSLDLNIKREVPLEFFEQQVGPFCGECNHHFMRSIDARARPIFNRLANDPSSPLSAEEVSTLRSWSLKTALVRSIVDEASGMRAPKELFHAFHASGGQVPPDVIQYAARISTRTASLTNRVLTVRNETEPLLRVQEMMVLFDTLVIVTIAFEGDALMSKASYIQEVNSTLQRFAPYLRLLSDGQPFPTTPSLPPMWIDVARSPGASREVEDGKLLPHTNYLPQTIEDFRSGPQ